VNAAGKPKGLKTRIGVCRDIAKLIIVHPLDDSAVGRVDDEPRGAHI
jgi:hypothetical protein